MSKRKAELDAARASALAAELHTLSKKLTRRLQEQASAGDLTPSQTSVLGRLNRDGPTTVTALARMEGFARNPWEPRLPCSKPRD